MTTDVKRKRYQFDLAALQRMAAVNYALLQTMVENLKTATARRIKVGRQLHFTIEVTETAPYTTEVRIQQQSITQQLPGLKETQLDVRLYHDAQLAEVVRSQGIERLQPVYPQPNPNMHQPDEKHQMNQFLSDWLQMIKRSGLAQEI
ncbi:DUF1249 domain-containing protein [Pseudidiomarina aestuarii]|nr:DUF1249 domain-containing protein [Pseudidiomarina aestuarii]